MLKDYLQGRIQHKPEVEAWEASIKLAAKPLLDDGSIDDSYVSDMISNVHEFGSYIVIVPNFAMPHAQNKGGVKQDGMSLLKLDQPVMYPEDKPVSLVLVLGATSSSGHLDLISDLAGVLGDDDLRTALEEAGSVEEIEAIIANVEEE
ncbi:hypothetical protein HMI01_03310 [Halolactibacillus miurensis]|uniref:Ascorbate-specific PTS system EIIA component n=1 Tax=Halolactibacillus miurensis TaxID=306541 RepID=A0A1I6Q207_9BACI|nr:PTS sugar transporter subunit IIA [Halolactibacillus miurensis]GEM03343.1 hypothetical protein HMI01_03310 [Halolactibacillus miurensis]SFS46442.1 PTS system, mannitol-specific IIA component/PTS system, ascorbate-specific IIA component [Halolactibacillus miurensis]